MYIYMHYICVWIDIDDSDKWILRSHLSIKYEFKIICWNLGWNQVLICPLTSPIILFWDMVLGGWKEREETVRQEGQKYQSVKETTVEILILLACPLGWTVLAKFPHENLEYPTWSLWPILPFYSFRVVSLGRPSSAQKSSGQAELQKYICVM